MKTQDEWMKRILAEEDLSLEDTLRLESALESSSGVRTVLQHAEEDAPSLTWRSKLNERLLQEIPQPKKRFQWKVLLGYGSAVTACALGAYVMFLRPNTVTPRVTTSASVNTESVLIAAHEANAFALDSFSSTGAEATVESKSSPGVTWSEEDLGAL